MTFGIKLQTIVKHTPTHRIGVVCPDMMGCCSDDETPVVYSGVTHFEDTATSELEIIGPENAIADPKKCGAGKGAACCIFLTCGPEGFCCERFSSLRHTLMFKDMSAKRNPAEMFPRCQLQEQPPKEAGDKP